MNPQIEQRHSPQLSFDFKSKVFDASPPLLPEIVEPVELLDDKKETFKERIFGEGKRFNENDVTTHHLSSTSYLTFALQLLIGAAKDILDGSKEKSSKAQRRDKENAIAWLNMEGDPLFTLQDCAELIENELSTQSVGQTSFPPLTKHPEILGNWVAQKPDDAYYYLRNYNTLFADALSQNEHDKSFNSIKESAEMCS